MNIPTFQEQGIVVRKTENRRQKKYDFLLTLPAGTFSVGEIIEIGRSKRVWSAHLAQHIFSGADEVFFDALLANHGIVATWE